MVLCVSMPESIVFFTESLQSGALFLKILLYLFAYFFLILISLFRPRISPVPGKSERKHFPCLSADQMHSISI